MYIHKNSRPVYSQYSFIFQPFHNLKTYLASDQVKSAFQCVDHFNFSLLGQQHHSVSAAETVHKHIFLASRSTGSVA